jgi:hypothetical protein
MPQEMSQMPRPTGEPQENHGRLLDDMNEIQDDDERYRYAEDPKNKAFHIRAFIT